jgi:hypothetical protein
LWYIHFALTCWHFSIWTMNNVAVRLFSNLTILQVYAILLLPLQCSWKIPIFYYFSLYILHILPSIPEFEQDSRWMFSALYLNPARSVLFWKQTNKFVYMHMYKPKCSCPFLFSEVYSIFFNETLRLHSSLKVFTII